MKYDLLCLDVVRSLKSLIFCALLIVCFSAKMFAQGEHWVNAYRKSNGKYVPGHWRTNPNSTKNDNYTTYPNINPHTGKVGTKPGDYIIPSNDPFNVPAIDVNALKLQLENSIKADEAYRSRTLAQAEYEVKEYQSCVTGANDFYELAKRANIKNHFRNGSYFVRFVSDNTCYDAVMPVKNNRVLFQWENCKTVSYPIKHGRGIVSVKCLLNDNRVHDGQLYFYLMHE